MINFQRTKASLRLNFTRGYERKKHSCTENSLLGSLWDLSFIISFSFFVLLLSFLSYINLGTCVDFLFTFNIPPSSSILCLGLGFSASCVYWLLLLNGHMVTMIDVLGLLCLGLFGLLSYLFSFVFTHLFLIRRSGLGSFYFIV